ncbi:hypothetical protein A4U88_0154 [Serratia marcescens]|nr:hypothetical protein A4U88_0154 [Serratia marcescens]
MNNVGKIIMKGFYCDTEPYLLDFKFNERRKPTGLRRSSLTHTAR